jgi:hypothetical protein
MFTEGTYNLRSSIKQKQQNSYDVWNNAFLLPYAQHALIQYLFSQLRKNNEL